jgi:GntR family transcriptional regulator / MocR family aminotransferase
MTPKRANSRALAFRTATPKRANGPGTGAHDDTPLNRQLYERLRTQILTGHLRPGEKLPSTRALAENLRVSRNTVLKAFDQLTAEGYLRVRGGSGSYVARELPDDFTQSHAGRRFQKLAETRDELGIHVRSSTSTDRAALAFAPARANRPFQPGIPALDAFPYAAWTKILTRHWKRRPAQLLGYAGTVGFPALREAIYSYLTLSRGVQCEPEQVIVVSGVQQALNLVSRVLLKPGDPVLIEEPGYFGAQSAFDASHAKMIPVEVDSNGLNVSAAIAASTRARLVYTTPGNQFPTGSSMSIARRLELLRWAAKTGAWIVEDDYDGEFRYSSRPLPALQGLDRSGSVIHVGSFSKLLFPAMRLGYMVVPAALLERMSIAKFALDYHTPTIDQAVVAEFMSAGHFLRHVRRMRALYLDRLEILLKTMHSELNGAVTIARPDAGMHVVASFSAGVDDTLVATAAHNMGVSSLPLSLCYLGRKGASGLILGYAAYSSDQIKQGCRQLARVLNQLQ